MNSIPDIIGIIGVALTLIAYFLLHINKIRPDKFYYPFLNTVGSCFILYSLIFVWNLAAGIMEICWLLISLAGLLKYLRKKYHA